MEKITPTHVLKKDFIWGGDGRSYKKGAPVFMKKRHQKHEGFCCNVFFLTKSGRLKVDKDGAMAWYSKDLFKPLKNWFEPVEGVENGL
jgi:hypothetical protein